MKICFSWLRKIAEDTDYLSAFGSALACAFLLAGTLALSAEKLFAPENEAAETREAAPARIAIRLEQIVVAPETEDVPPIETVPEETPPAPEIPPDPTPEPKAISEEKPVEKIDDAALRETRSEPIPEPPKEEAPTGPEEKTKATPEEKPQEASPPPQIAPAVPDLPVPAIDEAARAAAEQSLYGALAEAVSKKKFYPRAARRNGRTGTVFIRVQIGDCGKIKSYEIEKSDAHKSLIAGAKETLRRVAENFVAPAGTQLALPAAFIVPILYELN